jgi:ribosome-associated protein
LDEEKGHRITVLDVRGLTLIADYFVLCTGNSPVHIRAVAEGVAEKLRERAHLRAKPEGFAESEWVVMDYGDVILHVFSEDMREFYDLEGLWRDASVTHWTPSTVLTAPA